MKKSRLFDSESEEPFKLSRTKIEMFLNCPRCFYLDRVHGVSRPSGPAFTLNVAVDTLLKKEFDIHRAAGSKHPLMETYGVDAVPIDHELLDQWRHNFTGIQYLHEKTNLLLYGAIDDLWLNSDKEYIVVDYKATSKEGEIELTDSQWHDAYRRQMEIYQWLLRGNRLKVSDTGYFVYVNGKKDMEAFDGRLEFDVKLIPYTGSDNWIEQTILDISKCLNSKSLPDSNPGCDFCQYRHESQKIEFLFQSTKMESGMINNSANKFILTDDCPDLKQQDVENEVLVENFIIYFLKNDLFVKELRSDSFQLLSKNGFLKKFSKLFCETDTEEKNLVRWFMELIYWTLSSFKKSDKHKVKNYIDTISNNEKLILGTLEEVYKKYGLKSNEEKGNFSQCLKIIIDKDDEYMFSFSYYSYAIIHAEILILSYLYQRWFGEIYALERAIPIKADY